MRLTALILAVVSTMSAASAARADVYKNILLGLSEAGFQFIGEKNFLSGGADLAVFRTFNGETLDFGATELTLNGTPSLTISTGGRGLNVLDATFSTAGTPFTYSMTTDTGNQLTTVAGTFFADVDFSLNSFGFYDIDLNVSSRQTVTQNGRFDDSTVENDFDLGPIDLRGNLFADLLATITDPIFDALGVENIFAQFSASAQFEAKLGAAANRAQAKAMAGGRLTASELDQLASMSAVGAAMGFAVPDLSFLGEYDLASWAPGSVTVDAGLVAEPQVAPVLTPEPGTLVLLAAGGAALVFTRRRWR